MLTPAPLLQDRSAVDRAAHNREAAGSTPAPAPNSHAEQSRGKVEAGHRGARLSGATYAAPRRGYSASVAWCATAADLHHLEQTGC